MFSLIYDKIGLEILKNSRIMSRLFYLRKSFICIQFRENFNVKRMDFNDTTNVKESAQFIVENSKLVHLTDDSSYIEAAEIVQPLLDSWVPQSWAANGLHPSRLSDHKLKSMWIFLIDTLNYAFWQPPGKPLFSVNYQGKNYTGYLSLCAAIRKAIDQGIPILDINYWQNLTLNDLHQIFKSETETSISLIESRLRNIKEAADFLIKNFQGSVYEMIKFSQNSAIKLVNLISTNLTSYNDRCQFHGKEVSFLKRAQIFAADIHYSFLEDNDSVCHFNDIDQLTMFADYRVPQVLCYLGLLNYEPKLIQLLQSNPHLDVGSEIECEIRGCSIAAVEKFKKFLKPNVNSVLIDFCLWDYAKANEDKMNHIPVHKTVGIFY